LNLLTISATERVGSAAMKRWTWSGITSIAWTVNPYSAATVPMDCLEAGINRRYEHLPAILWAPNDVILEAEDSRRNVVRIAVSFHPCATIYATHI